MDKHLTSSEQRLIATKQLGKLEFAYSNLKTLAAELLYGEGEEYLDYGDRFDRNVYEAINSLGFAVDILKNHIESKIGYGLD